MIMWIHTKIFPFYYFTIYLGQSHQFLTLYVCRIVCKKGVWHWVWLPTYVLKYIIYLRNLLLQMHFNINASKHLMYLYPKLLGQQTNSSSKDIQPNSQQAHQTTLSMSARDKDGYKPKSVFMNKGLCYMKKRKKKKTKFGDLSAVDCLCILHN